MSSPILENIKQSTLENNVPLISPTIENIRYSILETGVNQIVDRNINESARQLELDKPNGFQSVLETRKNGAFSRTVATTYELFQGSGKSVEDIIRIRNINQITIENHLVECLKSSVPMDLRRLISPETYQEIMMIISSGPINGDCSKLSTIKRFCNRNVTYGEIKYAIAISETHRTFEASSVEKPILKTVIPEIIVPKPVMSETIVPETMIPEMNRLTPTVAVTYRLYVIDNKSIEEIANIRNMVKTTIENHIAECLKQGISIPRMPLTKDIYLTIMRVINSEPINGDMSKLAPIKKECPHKISYYQIKCALGIKESGKEQEFLQ